MKKNSKKPDIEEAQKTQQEGVINRAPTDEDRAPTDENRGEIDVSSSRSSARRRRKKEDMIHSVPTEDRSESEDAIHRVPTKKQEPRQRRRKKEEGAIHRASTDEDHGEIDVRSLRMQGSQHNEDEEGLSIPAVFPVLPLKD